MKLIRTTGGTMLEVSEGGPFVQLPLSWDDALNHEHLLEHLTRLANTGPQLDAMPGTRLAPIQSQEVWAAGVTYYRSRTARIEESEHGGGGTFYDRVYSAARPELFFKASPWRVRGPGEAVRIRRDATWNVPEPELALCINRRGEIVGYTIGNDMSSRDIEGENPLYLPQAKIYDGSCALGPAMLVAEAPIAPETTIDITISRGGAGVFTGSTTLSQMRRSHTELAEWLYRETSFPSGCVLLTGTGVVPPDDFTLAAGDEVRICIPPIGELVNIVDTNR